MKTPDFDNIVNSLNVDKEKVIQFFFVFSRYEYALKRASYISGTEGKSVGANWDSFASDIQASFWQSMTPQLKSAVKYIQTHPPLQQAMMKQGNGSYGLTWKETNHINTNTVAFLLAMVRRVRNNLFHGGKFPEQPKRDESRDTKLLDSCLIILNACLLSHDDVKFHFYDKIE